MDQDEVGGLSHTTLGVGVGVGDGAGWDGSDEMLGVGSTWTAAGEAETGIGDGSGDAHEEMKRANAASGSQPRLHGCRIVTLSPCSIT